MLSPPVNTPPTMSQSALLLAPLPSISGSPAVSCVNAVVDVLLEDAESNVDPR